MIWGKGVNLRGIYNNEAIDSFENSPFFEKLLGAQSIRYLKEDGEGNIWFIHEKTLGVIDVTGKEPLVIYFTELNNKLISGFEFIYPFNENNIFAGGEKGFFHINFEKYKQIKPSLNVQVRAVIITGKADSLLFGGYHNEVSQKQLQPEDNIPVLNSSWKTIHFQVSSAIYGYPANLEYSYFLKGVDETWSTFTKKSEIDYTKLAPGKYTFEVKVRDNLGRESTPDLYSFTLLPPWYKSLPAIIFYFLIFCLGIYFLRIWQQKKFTVQQVKYEEEQKRIVYIHDLELNKTASELVALRNEKLEIEVNFKNSELASSALHLVKKSELFANIKTALAKMMKELNNPQSAAELKKMIKTLSEDQNMDNEWENFTVHFDKVHSNFISELKLRHSTISSNELKLCAYLRMNLSTKEIARLLNISVRGVDISRYRLRKKLMIPSEVNLYDYMIAIQTKIN